MRGVDEFGGSMGSGTLGSFVSARIAQLGETPMGYKVQIKQVDHYVRLTCNVTIPQMQVHKTIGIAKILVLAKR